MTAPAKQSSRWGSFLSQAVAGVESRLDNMLTEGEDGQQQQPPQPQQQGQPQIQTPMSATAANTVAKGPEAASSKPSPAASRSSSGTRANANDRLQARLAKAMAAKNSPSAGADSKGNASPRSSVDTTQRNSVDRQSLDARRSDNKGDSVVPETASETTSNTQPQSLDKLATEVETSARLSEEKTSEPRSSEVTLEALPLEAQVDEEVSTINTEKEEEPSTDAAAVVATPLAQPTQAHDLEAPTSATETEQLKTQQQEEIQEYVERIDSLQSKLQYLSRSAAESAKKSAQAASSDTPERKLAEKDEKIALLMEEGQKLSSTEHKLRTTIKKLRQQMVDQEKQVDEFKKDQAKTVAEMDALRKRLDGDAEKEKRQEEAKKATAALRKEIDALKKESAAKDQAMIRLEHTLKTKAEKDAVVSVEAQKKALAAEQERQKELEETVATLKAESETLTNHTRLEKMEWTEKLERAQERARSTESELKHELLAMENKLEAMRSAAEEAASGSGGDGQVNLIRQIETLQSQYATASGNWQGIEASLLAKVSNLEKERDEAQGRESDMRRKARDAANRSRRLEEDVQDLQPALTTAKQELETCREEITSLQTSLKTTEAALNQARLDLEKQQRAGNSTRDLAADSERRQWMDEGPGPLSRSQSRPDSPLLSVARTMSADIMGFQLPAKSRRTPVPSSRPDSPAEGLSLGRRMSSQPFGRPSALSPVGSGLPPSPFSPFEPPPPSESNLMSPSIAERDDPNEDRIPSSPRQMAQDMVSISTVGAGPSVQLVERMSAAIRRLEAEKVAAKEEMTRICSQRDEARSDMALLMKDVETSKSATAKVPELEKELQALNSRYQTTLELLGEKSELVEELKADVQDVKAMYRELVERTIK